MATFIVKDRVAVWVTWTYEVEATDEEAAYDNYCQGDYTVVGTPTIGDNVAGMDNAIEVVGLKSEAPQ